MMADQCLKKEGHVQELSLGVIVPKRSRDEDIEKGTPLPPAQEEPRPGLPPFESSAEPPDDPSSPSQTPPPTFTPDYTRFSPLQKHLIMATISFCGFITPLASTAILVAIPEVASSLHTTGVIINISNALFFVSMALSPLVWGPLSGVLGRRPVFLASSVLLTAFCAGTAAAPEVVSYFVFRMLTAWQGTAFLVVGSVVIGDIYQPEERGRALGVFLSGTLVGPSVAPLLGGLVVTFTTWRVIYWVIAGLGGLSVVLIFFFLPETIPVAPRREDTTIRHLIHLTNPLLVIRPLLAHPNLWIAALAVSSLIWNQYSLLTPIRYVLNPRFNLETPLQSALFYLAPGLGYLFGTFVGGWWSDFVLARCVAKRSDGRRVPEDRLKAAVVIMAVVVPGCMVVYGWAVEMRVGGIPLVAVAMFFQAFSQLLCLPSLNTYLIDVFQDKGQSSVAVAGNYLARFMFAAAGSAVCLPAIRAIGVGWFSTVSALFISFTAGLVWLLTKYGEDWRTESAKKESVSR